MRLLVFNLATDDDDPILGFAASWVRALADRCRAVDVVTMRAGRFEPHPNVRVFSVGAERGTTEAVRALAFYRILTGLTREVRYDACFAHMMPLFALMGAPLLKARKIPITLWYAHGTTTRKLRLAEKVVDRVVTSTEQGFRIDSDKVRVLGQGIPTDLLTPLQSPARNDPPVLSNIGRVAPVKRVDLFLDAVAEVSRDRPVTGRVVGPTGDDSYAEKLLRQAEMRGIPDAIAWVGPLTPARMVDEYRRADLVVNVSETGSLDKTALEAMSCGVPVVTSSAAVGGVVGTVAPDLVVEASPSAIARACRVVLEMSLDARRELGLRMRRVVEEEHGLDRLADALVGSAIVTRGDT